MALIKTHFKTPLSFSRKRESGISVNLRMTQTRGFELVSSLKLFSFKKGVTLTELLVATAIASGVSLGIISIYIAHYRIFTNQNALIEAETQNKLAMAGILKYMREGIRFSYLADDYGTADPTTTLGIALLPLDANGNPYDHNLLDHVLFYRDPADQSRLLIVGFNDDPLITSRTIIRNDSSICCPPPTVTKVLATGVSDFTLGYSPTGGFLLSDYVTVTLTTESKTIYGKTFTSTQTFTAYIKNE